MGIEKMVIERSEAKEMRTVEVMPVLRFTDEMLADDTKYELTFSDMLAMFSKIEEKVVEVVEDEAEAQESQYHPAEEQTHNY